MIVCKQNPFSRGESMYTIIAASIMILTPLSFLAGLLIRRNKDKEESLFLTILRVPDSLLAAAGIAKTVLVDAPAGAPADAMLMNLFIYSFPMTALYFGTSGRRGIEAFRKRRKKTQLTYQVG